MRVVLALAPDASVAVIVADPALTPVARPVPSTVATPVSLLVHVTPPVPVTVTGVAEFVMAPLPSAPKSPSPQHCTVVSASCAHVWKPPAVMAIAPVMPATRTGVREPVVVPSPS